MIITAALSPPLSAPRPLSDSAASVRDAFGITAALSPVLWPPCLLGAQCRNVSSAYGRDCALSQLSIGIDITDGNGVGIAAIPQKSQCATGVAFSKIWMLSASESCCRLRLIALNSMTRCSICICLLFAKLEFIWLVGICIQWFYHHLLNVIIVCWMRAPCQTIFLFPKLYRLTHIKVINAFLRKI